MSKQRAQFVNTFDYEFNAKLGAALREALERGVAKIDPSTGEITSTVRWYSDYVRFDWGSPVDGTGKKTTWFNILYFDGKEWGSLVVNTLKQKVANSPVPCTAAELDVLNARIKKGGFKFSLRDTEPTLDICEYEDSSKIKQEDGKVAVLDAHGQRQVEPGAAKNSIYETFRLIDIMLAAEENILRNEKNQAQYKTLFGKGRVSLTHAFFGNKSGARVGKPKANPNVLIKFIVKNKIDTPLESWDIDTKFFDGERPAIVVNAAGKRVKRYPELTVKYNGRGEDGHEEKVNNVNIHRVIRNGTRVDASIRISCVRSNMGLSVKATATVVTVHNDVQTESYDAQEALYGDAEVEPGTVEENVEALLRAEAAAASKPAVAASKPAVAAGKPAAAAAASSADAYNEDELYEEPA